MMRVFSMSPSMTNPRGKLQTAFRRYRAPLLNALLFNGWAAALSYRCGLHGRLGVTRHRVTLPAARALPRPLRIAFASDFHAGPTTDPALFDALFDCLAQERPDVLLLAATSSPARPKIWPRSAPAWRAASRRWASSACTATTICGPTMN